MLPVWSQNALSKDILNLSSFFLLVNEGKNKQANKQNFVKILQTVWKRALYWLSVFGRTWIQNKLRGMLSSLRMILIQIKAYVRSFITCSRYVSVSSLGGPCWWSSLLKDCMGCHMSENFLAAFPSVLWKACIVFLSFTFVLGKIRMWQMKLLPGLCWEVFE